MLTPLDQLKKLSICTEIKKFAEKIYGDNFNFYGWFEEIAAKDNFVLSQENVLPEEEVMLSRDKVAQEYSNMIDLANKSFKFVISTNFEEELSKIETLILDNFSALTKKNDRLNYIEHLESECDIEILNGEANFYKYCKSHGDIVFSLDLQHEEKHEIMVEADIRGFNLVLDYYKNCLLQYSSLLAQIRDNYKLDSITHEQQILLFHILNDMGVINFKKVTNGQDIKDRAKLISKLLNKDFHNTYELLRLAQGEKEDILSGREGKMFTFRNIEKVKNILQHSNFDIKSNPISKYLAKE